MGGRPVFDPAFPMPDVDTSSDNDQPSDQRPDRWPCVEKIMPDSAARKIWMYITGARISGLAPF